MNDTVTDPHGAPLFPVFLKLAGRPCLLVGDGPEAGLKGVALLEAGAELTLLARTLPPELQAAHEQGWIRWLQEPFAPHHLDGMWWAVSASPDRKLNGRIARAAQERRIFLNVVDQVEHCASHWPAVVAHPPVMMAFSTGGTSPALAGWLRRRAEELVPPAVGELALWMAGKRAEVARRLPELAERGRFWREILDGPAGEAWLAGDREGAERLYRQLLVLRGIRPE